MKRRDLFKTPVLLAGLAAKAAPATPSTAPGLTAQVCRFIHETHYEEIPAEVIALCKKSILDGLGLALAGSASGMAPILKQYLSTLSIGEGKSTIIGTGQKVSPRFAALANGIFIHADDFDDTQLAAKPDRVYGLLTHPTVPVLPPVMALCESGRRTGKDLLLAYCIGTEVECKIAEAINPRHYNDGFHTTGTIGSFGSAAASCKLLGLNPLQTAHALGIVAAQAGGLRDNFGSMTKPFHAGHAAESGVIAADLAALGWTAATDVLEARFGFFQAAGGGFDPTAIVDRLGRPWTFASPGVSIKPYPSGSLTHPAMGEMARLIKLHDLKPAEIEKVEIGANHSMVTTLLHHRPRTGLQAKFSMEFGIAILLLERDAGLSQYTDAVAQRAEIQDLIGRIDFHVDPEAEQAGFAKMTSILKVKLKNGKEVSGRAEYAKGSPAQPMSFDEVADKLRGCAAFAGWPAARAAAIIEAVRELEGAKDLRRLSAALSARAAAR